MRPLTQPGARCGAGLLPLALSGRSETFGCGRKGHGLYVTPWVLCDSETCKCMVNVGGVVASSRFHKVPGHENKKIPDCIFLERTLLMYTAPVSPKRSPKPINHNSAHLCLWLIYCCGAINPNLALIGHTPFFCSVASFSTAQG